MTNISNIASLSNIAKLTWWWGSWNALQKAYSFDWTDDYISSNATIGRTGYDMNVAWNVSTGSDGDGSYMQFNGNYRRDLTTWSIANITPSSWPSLSQAASFTTKVRIKVTSFSVDNNTSGIFGGSNLITIYLGNNAWLLTFRIRNWWTFTDVTNTISLNTLYDAYLVYDQPTNNLYAYLGTSWAASTLLNVGGTTVAAATFGGTQANLLWDNAVGWWNYTSCNKYVYHAAIRNKALTQAEIDADIALWNTTKDDPSIVAYYIPENLQYNTQYISNPKALDQSPRSYTWATVTANTDVAPDWTTTADNIVFWAATHRLVQQTVTTLTWSSLASKTFIIKAFVKCTAWTQTFRFRMDNVWVDTNQYSSDFTATTIRQEFTFTRTLTSSTSGTGLFLALANNAAWTAQTVQAWNVRLYLVNETLRDESPNIWWYIGRKTNKVLSCWCKPWADSTSSSASQSLFWWWWGYMYITGTTNIPTKRIDTRLWAQTIAWTALWNWFRWKVHLIGTIQYTWWVFVQKMYANWVLQWTSTGNNNPPNTIINSWNFSIWVNTTTYYTWLIRDARIYTFTGSFTDADALAIYNGGEPSSTWVSKYLRYRPSPWESGTTAVDASWNSRDWTLNGWVTRVARPTS